MWYLIVSIPDLCILPYSVSEEKTHILSKDTFECINYMCGSRGGIGVLDPPPPPPLKNHKYLAIRSNTGPDPLGNHIIRGMCWILSPLVSNKTKLKSWTPSRFANELNHKKLAVVCPSFVDIFVIYVSCLSCCLDCSLKPLSHLLGKG